MLKVEIKGQRPFLTIGSSMELTLEGLEIVANYTEQPAGQQTALTPVIKSAGPARLSSCLFTLKNGVPVAGSRAIIADGANLTVENCCFQGLDTAIETHPSGGTTTLVRQTMILPGANQSSISPSSARTSLLEGSSNWGLRVQFYGGGRSTSRRLILEHCTMAGQGLLRLVDFPPADPLQVEARACVIRSMTLIGWEPTAP